MNIQCTHCGEPVSVNGIGRKKLKIPVKNIYDALRNSRTVGQAADKLKCSRGYIYQVLKEQGTDPKDVMETKGDK